MTNKAIHGDNREILKDYPDNTFDSIVTDPPYGINFMGKKWDYKIPTVEQFKECFRVLKPGGHMLCFAGTRTQHRMAVNIEDAGFEIRDMIAWVYGCLSEDTEILTKNGWERYNKSIKNRIFDEEIMTYDTENDIYKWEKPERWYEYNVNKDTAYRIESDKTDQIVSRGHRCIVEQNGRLVFKKIEELDEMEYMPTLRNDFFNKSKRKSPLLHLLLQWTGKRTGMEKTRSQRNTRLDKRKPRKLQKKNDRQQKSRMEGWCNLLQAKRQLRKSINKIREVSARIYFNGPQGWIRYGTPFNNSKENRQAINKAGMRASFEQRCNGQQTRKFNTFRKQRRSQKIRTRASYKTTLATVTPIEYSGIIFCPTVSTGAFIARRNGKIFITGNSGFPKNKDIGKEVDRIEGNERKVVGKKQNTYDGAIRNPENHKSPAELSNIGKWGLNKTPHGTAETKGHSPWEGFGSAIKPALEPITIARKPIEKGLTIAKNCLKWRTGGINIDGCRIGTDENLNGGSYGNTSREQDKFFKGKKPGGAGTFVQPTGRFPANLIHDNSEEVRECFPDTKSPKTYKRKSKGYSTGNSGIQNIGEEAGENSLNFGDSGNASRYFKSIIYQPKASKKERGEYNNHSTVKPINLMRYLVRLVTPHGGVVCDPFCGSGTTLIASMLEGFGAIGIDSDENSIEISKRRIDDWRKSSESNGDQKTIFD